MRRRNDPTPEPPPIDRARVRALVEDTNAAWERGDNPHYNSALAALRDLSGNHSPWACPWRWTSDDYRFSAEDLDALADRLARRVAP